MKSTSEKLQEIQQHGFHLDLGTVINEALENYKKITLTIGSLLLILILLFTIIGGAAAISFGISDLMKIITNINISEISILAIALNFAVTVIGTALVAPLTAGFLKITHEAQNNRHFGFSTAFSYYKSDYFKNIFTTALIIAVFTGGLNALLNLFMEFNGVETLKPLLNLFIGIFNGLANLFTMFAIPLIIFGNLQVKEAIKGSITIVSKKFWTILLLMLIGSFCSIIFGLMALCIGIFFTLPFMYSLQYTIYRNAIGIDDEIDMIESQI